jgi:uncharacterized GH25 family protein
MITSCDSEGGFDIIPELGQHWAIVEEEETNFKGIRGQS